MRITTSTFFSNLRLGLVCAMALTVSLPIALISLTKLMLFLCALLAITYRWLRRDDSTTPWLGWSTAVILLALAAFTLSLAWSKGTSDEALTALIKHGKLLLIPILLSLIRSRREALMALVFFVGGQVFLLASTWLLFLGAPVPWAAPRNIGRIYAVFSSYLDQSIMSAVFAAICWHLRSLVKPRWLPAGLAALALVCVFFIFEGRTGHVVGLALITMAAIWALPRHLRIGAVVVPCVLLAVLAACSDNVRKGLTEISHGVTSFNQTGETSTSSAIRLNFWLRSLESIAQEPWHGSGVGSWSHEFKLQQAQHAPNSFTLVNGNPHQEFLLWGVELGLPGIALLLGVMLALYRDSQRLEPAARRALQSVLLALILSCLFNSALYDALVGDFFCVTLALLLALTRADARPHSAAATALPSR